MILDIFTTNKFDDKIALNDGKNEYTYRNLKNFIASKIEQIKNKSDNVIITGDNNFSFIVNFFASVFCDKNIYLIADKKRLKDIAFEHNVLDSEYTESINNYEFSFPDIKKPNINFYTSGSSGTTPKVIKKSLFNLIREGEDIGKEFGFCGKDFTVLSTTTMCHLFGLTFHFMTAMCNGLIINTQSIPYSECVDKKNAILVSTPAFLSSFSKYDAPFKINPEYIISAGSKLNEKVFEKLEQTSKIIEIYGSTETGVVANKTHFNSDFKVFTNVKLNKIQSGFEIVSDYFYENKTTLNDEIELNKGFLKVGKRTDRILKIFEKRISADELEENLRKNDFVKDCYITKIGDKLACLTALTPKGQEYLLEKNVPALTKTLKQFLYKSSEIVPQKWKYIDEIPMTRIGKINKRLIEHFFNINLSLPVVLDREISRDGIVYKIFFSDRCNFFQGHFPEFKVVPGVLQLYLAKEFANIHFNLTLGQGQYKKIKFSNVIEPNNIINLKLEKSDKYVYYEFYSDIKKYSSGIFLCENIFEDMQL